MVKTKKHIAPLLQKHPSQRFFLTKKNCQDLVAAVWESMVEILRDGDDIIIDGVGILQVKDVGPKKFFNYKKGAVDSKEHVVLLKFKPTIKMRKHFKWMSNQRCKEDGNEMS